jgi:hypothetical protein
VRYPRPNHALQLTASSLVSLEVTWENPRHPVPGRDRPIQPGSPESGAEPGSSRPELLKPVQWSGAVEPVSARAGRQECLWVPCFVGIEVAQAPWEVALRPSGERWAVPTAAGGVVTLVERLQALHPTLLVLAATGAWSGPPQRRGPRRAAPSAGSTRDRRALVPAPPDSGPRRRRGMPARWRILLR